MTREQAERIVAALEELYGKTPELMWKRQYEESKENLVQALIHSESDSDR